MIIANSNGVSIWKILITILVLPLKLLLGVMPEVDIPFFSDPATSVAESVGHQLGVVNSFVPVTEALTLAALVLGVVLPVAGAYTVGNWVWRHIPTILGVGTGAG